MTTCIYSVLVQHTCLCALPQVGCRLVGTLLRERNITLMQVLMAGNAMEEHVLQVCCMIGMEVCVAVNGEMQAHMRVK